MSEPFPESWLTEGIRRIRPADPCWREQAQRRIHTLTMPPWALGRLLDLAVDLAGMTRSLSPAVARRAVVVMAGDHGMVAEGVSAFPQAVTVEMVHNFVRGGAAINVLARQADARVLVVDVGVAGDLRSLASSEMVRLRRIAPGTANMATGPAMSREQAIRAIETGWETGEELAETTDLYATGDMGIGNTTPSSAIVATLCEVDPDQVTGRGTGVDETIRMHKAQIIRRAIALNRPDPADPLDVLAKVGGLEIGAIAGVVLAAAAQRKPVLIDGFISTTGALLAQRLCPASADYMIAAHRSVEPGHTVALEQLGKTPLLDLDMRLGEGTGAVLAMHLVEAAVGILTDMATFDEAGVSGGGT
ncbi:MAG: nicotinate-nucleotide--dimethylbenzimidazole phosphoribosyltransferase [Thioalkalivibrio sp.]|jgi:nicotinate-nucleotide--dimethylbenzimidazole phosphoribosyltransferase|nr:nicotinate-nucleotide--dimethylbenzimidazole phosphoribosyltransferase [Thioalkalivibrio sp.]NBB94755.1 nicotinate-nucleotide--dimethylbenzimidazole phosphoribosyltransferase [Planctomycetota bacterium]